MNVQTPMEVTISVYQGHQTEGFMDQVPLASVVVERWYMAPGVRRIPITEDGLTATLFLPPGRTTGETGGRCVVVVVTFRTTITSEPQFTMNANQVSSETLVKVLKY